MILVITSQRIGLESELQQAVYSMGREESGAVAQGAKLKGTQNEDVTFIKCQ